jgi:hypothetical protein
MIFLQQILKQHNIVYHIGSKQDKAIFNSIVHLTYSKLTNHEADVDLYSDEQFPSTFPKRSK